MIRSLIVQTKTRKRLQSGPLGPYLESLAEDLHREGYKDRTICRYLRNADLFGRWLAEQAIPICAVDKATVARYVNSLQRLKQPARSDERLPSNAIGIPKILAVLTEQGIVPPPALAVPTTTAQRWLNDFADHLERVAGLAIGTRHNYLRYAEALIQACFGTAEPDWRSLSANDVTTFVCEQAARLKRSSSQNPVTATRAFLRFLSVKGVVHAGLVGAVPTVHRYKQACLPNYLSQEQVDRVLASCDENTSLGRRDRAIIILLVRLGLRAGEVAHLCLEDIDWQEGCVLIRAGKSGRERSLPLTQEVGITLIAYLQHARPCSGHRELLLRARAPHIPLKSGAISAVAVRHLQRAGVSSVRLGSHVFRHTAATHMVQSGACFKEVADVLGHACLDTTFIYCAQQNAMLSCFSKL